MSVIKDNAGIIFTAIVVALGLCAVVYRLIMGS